MSTKEDRLYMLYFYNSVIEFIYFIILYIEIYGVASLRTLCKHVKFFKTEVATLILSFEGKSFEDKLCQMLGLFDCFEIFNNEISVFKNTPVKDIILEDLVIGKSVDLVLHGIDNISEICDNLKHNNAILIQKEENIIDIFERSTYISLRDKQVLTLNHVHALLGYDDQLSNSVISYFHGILCYETVLSFHEIKNHCRFLSICGIRNMLVLFSILHGSNNFVLQDSFIALKKKSKKYPRLQPISMEFLHDRFSSRALYIGQIIQNTYGSFLHKWTGEIGSLSLKSGVVYCVVDFTNGFQGIFNVYFNETALRVVSEIDDIKKYIKIRDRVEFDAEYYNGKSLDRCWRATRLKVLHESKLKYNEVLFEKVCSESESLRKKCANNDHCLVANNIISPNSIISYSLKDKNSNSCDKILLDKTEKNEIDSINNSVDKSTINEKGIMKNYARSDYKTDRTFYSSFSNLLILDYSLMFGFIYMLMEDKGFALAKYGSKFYNILFMKNSIYTQNGTTDLKRGQKVLALIPYYDELEEFCISTFVYGLNYVEFDETEKNNVLPHEFALEFFKKEETGLLKCKFCCKFGVLNGLLGPRDRTFDNNFKQKLQLIELYDHILGLYKTPFKKDCVLQFLSALFEIYSRDKNMCQSVLHFLIQLSRCFTKIKAKKYKQRTKRPRYIANENPTVFQPNLTNDNVKNSSKENSSPSCSKLPSLISPNSVESLNSFKSCHFLEVTENSQDKIEHEKIPSIDNTHNSCKVKSSSSSCLPSIHITLSGVEDLNPLKTCQSLDSIENFQAKSQNLCFNDNLDDFIKDCTASNCYLSPLRKSTSSSESLNSFKTCHSSESTDNFCSCESDSLTPSHSPVSFHSINAIQTSDDQQTETKESTSLTLQHSFDFLQSAPGDQISTSDETHIQKIGYANLTSDHSCVSLQSKDKIPSSDDRLLVKTTVSTCLNSDILSVSLQAIDQTSTSENIPIEAKESNSSTPDHSSASLKSIVHGSTCDDILNHTQKSTGSTTLHHPLTFLQTVDQIPTILIHSIESSSLNPDHSTISLQTVDQILTPDDILVQTKRSASINSDHSIKSSQSIDFSQNSAVKSKESPSFILNPSSNSSHLNDKTPTSCQFKKTKASDKMEFFKTTVNDTKFDLTEKFLNSNKKSKTKKLHQLRSDLCFKSLIKQSVKKKRPNLLHNAKFMCKNCTSSPVTICANLSLISSSFYCYTSKLNGFEVTLPLPKKVVPDDVRECMKLNSCYELTVVPNVIFNLSHIIKVNVPN